MLPAWATVAIALGASAITAVAALGGALLQGRREREGQLRTLIVESAHDFATGILQAIMGVRDALEAPRRQIADQSAIWAAEPEARRRADEAEARLARVHLLVGPDTDTGRAAQTAVDQLVEAVDALLPAAGTDEEKAERALRVARDRLRAFEIAAGRAIREP